MALMLFDICFNKWMNIKNKLAQFISMIETNLCIYYVYKMRSLLWMKFNIKRRWLYSIIINEVWWFRVTSNFINNSMILKLIFMHGFQVFRAYKMKMKKQILTSNLLNCKTRNICRNCFSPTFSTFLLLKPLTETTSFQSMNDSTQLNQIIRI